MKNTKTALHWIVSILQSHQIPFLVSGGLATRLYGATRELADIDIDIPEESFAVILSAVKPYIIFGPTHFRDENWDLFLMTPRYEGQDIDLSSAEAKVFDVKQKIWIDLKDDFSQTTMIEAYGITVPVVAKDYLIHYKKILKRDVDVVDVARISNQGTTGEASAETY